MRAESRGQFVETWMLEANRIALLRSSLPSDRYLHDELTYIVRRIKAISVVAANETWPNDIPEVPDATEEQLTELAKELKNIEDIIRGRRQNMESVLFSMATRRRIDEQEG